MAQLNFSTFNPKLIPWQYEVLYDIKHKFDYSNVHEILLSGSVGSAKSTLCAWLVVRHCLEFTNSRALLARKSMPDLKATIFREVLDMLEGSFIEGVDYTKNETNASIYFIKTGSEVISRSWSDKRYKSKARSLKLSMMVLEEGTENNEEDKEAYDEFFMRLNRISEMDGKENLIIIATNPDSPAHWIARRFFDEQKPTRHVYYSLTKDNPFLPANYAQQIEDNFPPDVVDMMLNGVWREIRKKFIYSEYNAKVQFKRNESYKWIPRLPIWISCDQNIGEGKPMSACIFQFNKDTMHIGAEVVIDGMRTADMCEEFSSRGFFDHPGGVVITGDCNGSNKHTTSPRSDYEIIEHYISNYRTKKGGKCNFEISVPRSNGLIKARHNLVNGYCKNGAGKVRLYVYKDAPTADKGLRLTVLKKNGLYIEDDGPAYPYQHISTAIGYGLRMVVMGIDDTNHMMLR